MLYLTIQMAFLLLVSGLIGVVIGWWARRISQKPNIEGLETSVVPDSKEADGDVYTLKNKLDKCFDENASLRRHMKATQTQLDRLKVRYEVGNTTDDDKSDTILSDALQDKVIALMDDLQLRDDTILALEKEIEAMKNKG